MIHQKKKILKKKSQTDGLQSYTLENIIDCADVLKKCVGRSFQNLHSLSLKY